MIALSDLEDRNVMKALRHYNAVIIPAQYQLRFILHQVMHSLEFWFWAAMEFSQKLNNANDQTYYRLPNSAGHLHADSLCDLLLDTLADVAYHIDVCSAQLTTLLGNHELQELLEDDDEDSSDDDEDGKFQFMGHFQAFRHTMMIIAKEL